MISKPGPMPSFPCPLCEQPMGWDNSPQPETHDWCHECRDAVAKLMTEETDLAKHFRHYLRGYSEFLTVTPPGVDYTPGIDTLRGVIIKRSGVR